MWFDRNSKGVPRVLSLKTSTHSNCAQKTQFFTTVPQDVHTSRHVNTCPDIPKIFQRGDLNDISIEDII